MDSVAVGDDFAVSENPIKPRPLGGEFGLGEFGSVTPMM
jgi:hypothetical protein